jgi:hypothetical protein
MSISVETRGPLFTPGLAERLSRDAADEWAGDLATLGNVMVRANLNAVLRTQTPYYRTRIAAQKERPLLHKVTDQGVIYGPWLEGVGSRNRTTRFKGYFTFRRTTQQLAAKAREVGGPIVARLVQRLGG